MDPRFKKILTILIFLFATLVIGFIIYTIFFKPLLTQPTDNTNLTNIDTNAGLPTAGLNVNIPIIQPTNGVLPLANANINNAAIIEPPSEIPATDVALGGVTKVSVLTTNTAKYTTLLKDGKKIVYYDESDGKFYQITSDGISSPLSDKVFFQVEKATWNPDGTKAVLEYPDGANIIYDFYTNSQVTLPKHWEDFDFSPSGDKIISKSIGVDPENRFLIVSDLNGSRSKIISSLGENADKVIPNWSPNNQMAAMFVEGIDYDRQEVFFLGLNDENFKSVVVAGKGFQGIWSPQGDKLLHSVYTHENDNRPALWIVDANVNSVGQNRQSLKLNTWAEKCTFYDNSTVYCAVPSTLAGGAALFPDELDTAPDYVYKININSGTKTLIAKPEGGYKMENPIVSDDGKYIYFTDKITGRLLSLKLK